MRILCLIRNFHRVKLNVQKLIYGDEFSRYGKIVFEFDGYGFADEGFEEGVEEL